MTQHLGFLFNHEAIHQIRHLAPMIPALVARAENVKISVLASTSEQLQIAREVVGDIPGCSFHLLRLPRSIQVLDRIFRMFGPFKRVATLISNLDLFRSLDVLVVPESTSLMLKENFGLKNLKMVRVCHGAGDRDIAWSSNISKFDFVMLPGEKHRSRLLSMGLVKPENNAVIGYLKFDSLSKTAVPHLPFKDQRPIVVYNPHFDPYLSSWYDMGHDILEYFANSQDFNLVFAPHIMLFQRKIHTSLARKIIRWQKNIPPHLRSCSNIITDVGSSASTDMTYTRAADIYLGDVSSQVYEFVAQPRPCVFLNAHDAKWKNDPTYKFWSMGPVVSSISELDRALRSSLENPSLFKMAQTQLFKDSIDLQTKPSTERAAEALMTFMKLRARKQEPEKKFG